MAKHTLKILRCEQRKIFKVCLAIFQHYEIKGYAIVFRKVLKICHNYKKTSESRRLSNISNSTT